jgi:hypothetical protein
MPKVSSTNINTPEAGGIHNPIFEKGIGGF